MLKSRDREIIEALEKFHVLERDHIANMFFNHCKKPITSTNFVLKRLRDRDYIDCDDSRVFEQNIYFPKPSKVKKNSQKIGHFLMIADIYLDMKKYYTVKKFEIEQYIPEFKLIPDIFTVWGGSYWWIEAQNSLYSSKVMYEKLDKYEELYRSGKWKDFHFQSNRQKMFPHVLIIGKGRYNVDQYSFRVLQADTLDSFASKQIKPKKEELA